MFDLEETTITDLQAAIADGRLTAKAITAQYLERIEALNQRGPILRHVIEVNPEALTIAEQLDAERQASGLRGQLHGIPVLVKDNIDTADQMTTTAGSLALEGHIAADDAFLVGRLRAAGAVLLGKANMSEWANFRSTRSNSGWSARGGQARNPYALDRSPGGSSSGSAGAVSANLCAVAVGTETSGSIVAPAAFCGVVGIKPTVGLISRAGVIPISSSMDTAGPMARTVADAAILLGAMTGIDLNDGVTEASTGRAETDYTKHLKRDGLSGAKIGIWRPDGYHPSLLPILEAAIATLRSAGATVRDPLDAPTLGQFGNGMSQIMLCEFKATVNVYLQNLPSNVPVRCLDDLIAFNEAHKDREMPFFGQELLLFAQKADELDSPDYQKSRDDTRRLAREEGLHAVLDTNNLDALVALTTGPAHLTDPVNGDRGGSGTWSLCAAAGCPSITVPAGDIFGLPVGISFMGRAFAEGTLIRLAYAFEQLTQARRSPRFLPTIDL